MVRLVSAGVLPLVFIRGSVLKTRDGNKPRVAVERPANSVVYTHVVKWTPRSSSNKRVRASYPAVRKRARFESMRGVRRTL